MSISNPPVQTAAAVSNSVAFGSNNAAGNFLVAMIQTSAAVTSPGGVTDTAGNTWVRAVVNFQAGPACGSEIWYVENCAGGANTVTFANGFGSSFAHIGVAEYSGVATSSSLDKTANNNNTTGNPDSGSTTTTTQSDELLIGVIANDGAATETWAAGWTERYDDATAGASRAMSWADQIVSVTGTYNASATISGGADWMACVATFKATAGGGAVQPPVAAFAAGANVFMGGAR